ADDEISIARRVGAREDAGGGLPRDLVEIDAAHRPRIDPYTELDGLELRRAASLRQVFDVDVIDPHPFVARDEHPPRWRGDHEPVCVVAPDFDLRQLIVALRLDRVGLALPRRFHALVAGV